MKLKSKDVSVALLAAFALSQAEGGDPAYVGLTEAGNPFPTLNPNDMLAVR